MKIENPEINERLTTRLNRMEGQIRGVRAMIEGGRDCREILQQLTAVRSAAQAASVELVRSMAAECILNMQHENPAARRELVDDLLFWVGKAPAAESDRTD